MTKVNVELVSDVTVSKGPRDKTWLAEVTVDVSKLSADIVAKLAVHGLVQKIADAASASKTKDEALGAMGKALDALYAGDWSSRVAGQGADERTTVARQIVRQVFKQKVGAKSEAWAEFTGLSDADANAKLDAMFAKNEAKLASVVDKELERRKAERETKRGIAADFDL